MNNSNPEKVMNNLLKHFTNLKCSIKYLFIISLVKNYYFYFFSYGRYILLQNLSSQRYKILELFSYPSNFLIFYWHYFFECMQGFWPTQVQISYVGRWGPCGREMVSVWQRSTLSLPPVQPQTGNATVKSRQRLSVSLAHFPLSAFPAAYFISLWIRPMFYLNGYVIA